MDEHGAWQSPGQHGEREKGLKVYSPDRNPRFLSTHRERRKASGTKWAFEWNILSSRCYLLAFPGYPSWPLFGEGRNKIPSCILLSTGLFPSCWHSCRMSPITPVTIMTTHHSTFPVSISRTFTTTFGLLTPTAPYLIIMRFFFAKSKIFLNVTPDILLCLKSL